MKGLFRSIGLRVAQVILGVSTVVLAVIGIPAVVMTWCWATERFFAEHDQRVALSLLQISGFALLLWVVAFAMVRRWRPDTLQLKPMKSKKAERWLGIYSSYALVVMFAAECFLHLPGTSLERLALALGSVALLFAGFHVCIAWHELGHLLAALMAGFEPLHFRVGRGSLLWRGHGVGGLLVEWRLLPGSGFVKASPPDARFSRWKQWLMTAGGPAATLALSLLLWRLAPRWPSAESGAWRFACERVDLVLLVCNSWLLLGNLMPRRMNIDGTEMFSDGMVLLALLRPLGQSPVESTRSLHVQRIGFFWESGQYSRAWAALDDLGAAPEPPCWLDFPRGVFAGDEGEYTIARERLGRFLARPDMPPPMRQMARLHLAIACAGMGETRAARAHCVKLLRSTPRGSRATWFDYCASILAITGRRELLKDARRWINQALARDSGRPVFQVTDAILLAEEGEGVRAERALRELLRNELDGNNRRLAAFYLARLLRERCAPAPEVAKWRRRALEGGPQLWLSRRVTAELPEPGPFGAVTRKVNLVNSQG